MVSGVAGELRLVAASKHRLNARWGCGNVEAMKNPFGVGMLLVAPILFGSLQACGGGAKVGEPCTKTGSVDECASGGVCTSNGSTSPRCLTVCTDQSQCATTEDCNGVEGSSVKACRPKDTKTGK